MIRISQLISSGGPAGLSRSARTSGPQRAWPGPAPRVLSRHAKP